MTKTKADTRARAIEEARLVELCKHLARGVSLKGACGLTGIRRQHLYEWMARDPEIEARVEGARSHLESDLVDELRSHAASGSSPAATVFILERRFKGRWGKQAATRVEQTGKDGGPQTVEVKLTIEQAIAGARGEEPTE